MIRIIVRNDIVYRTAKYVVDIGNGVVQIDISNVIITDVIDIRIYLLTKMISINWISIILSIFEKEYQLFLEKVIFKHYSTS